MGADRHIHTEPLGLDPQQHGLSMERVPLHVGHVLSGLFGDLPPVGVPFAEVSALLNGYVLVTFGARLPDNHVLREGGCCARASVMRELAVALVRAADLSDAQVANAQARTDEPSSPGPHEDPPAHTLRGAP